MQFALLDGRDPAESVPERYVHGFGHALAGAIPMAVELFGAAWDRRGDLDLGSDPWTMATASGVWLLALADREGVEVPVDTGAVREAVEPDLDRLSTVVRAVFEWLSDDATGAVPDDLRADLEDPGRVVERELRVYERLRED